MWTAIISKLLGSFGEKAVDAYLQRQALKTEVKLEKLRGKAAWERAKTERAEKSEGRDADWELLSLKNSGYKDEWTLGLVSIPMIMSFIPPLQQYVADGFTVLDGTPQWYRFLIMSIFLATYGIRWWRRKV